MKTIIKKTFFALVVLLSIFILGIFIPTLLSLFVVVTNSSVTLNDAFTSQPFWLLCIFGMICSTVYINSQVRGII